MCLLEDHFLFASPSWVSFRLFISCSVSFLISSPEPFARQRRAKIFWDRLAAGFAKDRGFQGRSFGCVVSSRFPVFSFGRSFIRSSASVGELQSETVVGIVGDECCMSGVEMERRSSNLSCPFPEPGPCLLSCFAIGLFWQDAGFNRSWVIVVVCLSRYLAVRRLAPGTTLSQH
jgi:hypothetical protein